jgi:hypothetical protein
MCHDGYVQAKTHKYAVLSVTVPKDATGEGDIAATLKLKKMEFAAKKDFMAYIKAYLGRIVALLKKNGAEDDDVKHF